MADETARTDSTECPPAMVAIHTRQHRESTARKKAFVRTALDQQVS
jgi:hypothetical protein